MSWFGGYDLFLRMRAPMASPRAARIFRIWGKSSCISNRESVVRVCGSKASANWSQHVVRPQQSLKRLHATRRLRGAMS